MDTNDPDRDKRRLEINVKKFTQLLQSQSLDICETEKQLRDLSWCGIPDKVRGPVWKILLGCASLNPERRARVEEECQKDYTTYVETYWKPVSNTTTNTLLEEVRKDVTRTKSSDHFNFLMHPTVIHRLERILFICAIRNSSTAYTQGMNFILAMLFIVFFGHHTDRSISVLRDWNPSDTEIEVEVEVKAGIEHETETKSAIDTTCTMPSETVMLRIEADCFWCLFNIIDKLSDMYNRSLSGILTLQQELNTFVTLVNPRLEQQLYKHFSGGFEFTTRWFLCLMIQELPWELGCYTCDALFSEFSLRDSVVFKQTLVYMVASYLTLLGTDFGTMTYEQISSELFNQYSHNSFRIKDRRDIELLLAQTQTYKIWSQRQKKQ